MNHDKGVSVKFQRLCWFGLAGIILNNPFAASVRGAEPFVAIKDESKVPPYSLPPILADSTSSIEETNAAWKKRRLELSNLFTEQVYGAAPTTPFKLTSETIESGASLNGKAIRHQIRLVIETDHGQLPIDVLIFRPAKSKEAVPCFIGLNFTGNHTVAHDPEIVVTKSWMRNDKAKGIENNQTLESLRGDSASRWPIELIVSGGCAVVTAYYGDIDPDFDDGFKNGVHGLFPDHQPSAEHKNRWGTIAGWSWGLSRMLDCVQANVPEIDSKKVMVIGHSRLGKAAIWAGVTDERFAGIISNNSGCGGAALSKRIFGETVGRINESFPHWFCPNFRQYNLKEAELPVDQHQLLALVAPRALYVASASLDSWADPVGEFLATKLAGDVYSKLGLEGLKITEFPKAGESSIGRVSYHLRDGSHDVQAWDWERYLRFAEQLP
jgi:hypothetical protein